MTRKTYISLLITLVVLAGSAVAGPPLICFPFEIGEAKSLPWGGAAWHEARGDYDLKRLVPDTLALLEPNTPVIVRMETLRRATIYASKDAQVAQELLNSLVARARSAEAKGRPNALAAFDAGYLVETYKQVVPEMMPKREPGETTASDGVSLPKLVAGINGYAWIVNAIGLRIEDPEMELAAAIITERRGANNEHLRKAAAGAGEGSLLARNLVSHFAHRGRTIAELRAGPGVTKN